MSKFAPRVTGMQHVHALAADVRGLLDGTSNPDPSQHGLTSEEERATSSTPQVQQPAHKP